MLDSLVERVSMPDIPDVPDVEISGRDPDQFEANSADYVTSSKLPRDGKAQGRKYPDMARLRQTEGSVTVRFVITPDGNVKRVGVVEVSKCKILDTEALKAIKDCAPFPKPPPHLFKREVTPELTIVFELTRRLIFS
nr:energy transducer TonB [Desulfobacterales bacterium]